MVPGAQKEAPSRGRRFSLVPQHENRHAHHSSSCSPFSILLFFFNLFIWLHRILGAARGIFSVVARGIQFPNQGSNLGPLCWEHRVLATGPPGKSLRLNLKEGIGVKQAKDVERHLQESGEQPRRKASRMSWEPLSFDRVGISFRLLL